METNVTRFKPRSNPAQADAERLIRIESKLTKMAKAHGVDTRSYDVPEYATRVLFAVIEDKPALSACHLQISLGELYEAAELHNLSYPVGIAVQGRLIGTLSAPPSRNSHSEPAA